MDTTLQNNTIGPGSVTPAPTNTTKVLGTSQTTPPKAQVAVTTPTTITSASLQTPTPVDIPTKPAPTTPPVTENLADSFLKATEVADTEAQKTSQDISTKLFNLIPELKGQTQALATAQDQAGVNRFKQELQGINSQILKKQAEIQQDDITLIANMRAEERRDTLLPFAQQGQAKLAGDAAIMRALKTSEIGVLNATALAKQGDIALAMETAKQAVDVKYAPYKEAIETYQAQLQALDPILSRDEKKQARAQEIKGQLAMKEIDKVANLQKDALSAAIENNAPQSILDRISKARTIEDITAVGSQYLVSPKNELVKLENGKTILVDKRTGKVVSSYGGGSSSGNSYAVTSGALKNTYNNDAVSLISKIIKDSGAKPNQQMTDAINVISGLQEFVENNPEGEFIGLAPTKIAGKLRGAEARTERILNRSDVAAINLKVQQWASGASLTEQQTKAVEKLTPDKNDTDFQVRNKINGLANYMLSQVGGQLAGQGVDFKADKIDYFAPTAEQELAKKYKDPATKARIEQAIQLYPDATAKEILQIIN